MTTGPSNFIKYASKMLTIRNKNKSARSQSAAVMARKIEANLISLVMRSPYPVHYTLDLDKLEGENGLLDTFLLIHLYQLFLGDLMKI